MTPLDGVRIAVTRVGERNLAIASALRTAGATVHEVPLTRIESLDQAALVSAVAVLASYNWVLLTSVNAVEHLARAMTPTTAHLLGTRKLAVVGPTTARAADALGWRATLIPERFAAESLVDAMSSRADVDGARMLYPSAQASRDVLPDGLRSLGAIVDVVHVYRSAPDPAGQAQLRKLATAGALDLVTVAAPSAVDALLDALPAEYARRLPVACIGPVTARAARLAGFPVKVESAAATAEGLVRSIVAAFASLR